MDKQIPAEIVTYLKSLLSEAGQEITDDALNSLYEKLDTYVATVIVASLPAEYLNDFSKLNESNADPIEIEKLLIDKLPNAKEIFSNAFVNFKKKYLEDNRELQSPSGF